MYDPLASLAVLHALQRTGNRPRSALPTAPVRPHHPTEGRVGLARLRSGLSLRRLADLV